MTDNTATAPGNATTVVYAVSGMSCGHCEKAVGAELTALPGVIDVRADAASGRVAVSSVEPLDDDVVRAAVDEAGYKLVGRA
ncbi:heavy-metal-associated domain-containing protein [Streptomyces sp. RB6PN25]|uniref:Heavy-metal-associated domain-containing protein n=1 Tax=Streptomyces humicola TaxID=2953240 RepID=A0ABT1PYT0_9ACTN|nr:heavy-metal-associated domain-containing protein [Streptomyces humicola]MCQ4082830.1 heavy-metal-associated domain-containing protein [Streptomyces humicola]